MTPSPTTDRARQVLTVAAAVGQAVLPTLLAPQFEESEQPPDVLSPAPAVFAVWLPIFVTSLVHARFQAMPGRREDPVLRTVGGPATLAYAATAAPGGADTSVARTYLATIAWALGGIVAGQRLRSPAVAASAVAGLVPVGGLLARSALAQRASVSSHARAPIAN